MGQILDFSEIKKSEKTIRKTWSEFRDALAKEVFTFDEVEKAKGYTFLKVYDDLFHQHSGIDHKTIKIKDAASVVKGLIHCVHLAFCRSLCFALHYSMEVRWLFGRKIIKKFLKRKIVP